MQKYLSIPVTTEGNQLIPVTDVKLIEPDGGTPLTATDIMYGSGKVITLTHATVGAASATNSATQFRNWLQREMTMALQSSWTEVAKEAIPAYAVSAVVIA